MQVPNSEEYIYLLGGRGSGEEKKWGSQEVCKIFSAIGKILFCSLGHRCMDIYFIIHYVLGGAVRGFHNKWKK